MSNWMIICLIVIGIFFLIGIYSNILIFHSYALSYTKAKEEWEAFKKSLEKEGYEILLLRIENDPWKGYTFIYTQKKK